jgi:hypothetical protein
MAMVKFLPASQLLRSLLGCFKTKQVSVLLSHELFQKMKSIRV